ncbi:hypothetical protein QR98_0088040 [Sarcoptes scabiei]|uniref:Uncharacterized protein n=1 Tax=Sarcoptes scabiei TaxID=52283 RepID=A0A132AH52_SARSC|nr:hypothetical protein QR98_0088040 [Sarcoptes scabiei]
MMKRIYSKVMKLMMMMMMSKVLVCHLRS